MAAEARLIDSVAWQAFGPVLPFLAPPAILAFGAELCDPGSTTGLALFEVPRPGWFEVFRLPALAPVTAIPDSVTVVLTATVRSRSRWAGGRPIERGGAD